MDGWISGSLRYFLWEVRCMYGRMDGRMDRRMDGWC